MSDVDGRDACTLDVISDWFWKIIGKTQHDRDRLNSLLSAMRHEDALRLCDEILRFCREFDGAMVEPNRARILHHLGVIASQSGRYELAVEYIERAISLHGTDPAMHNDQGAIHIALRQFDRAVVCYQRALELNPDVAEAHHQLGLAHSHRGQLEEAISCFGRALQLFPAYAEAHCNLGVVLEQVGDFQGAQRCWREALKHDSHHVDALAELAKILRGKLPAEEAAALHQSVTDPHVTNGKRAAPHFGLARVLDEQGDYAAAADHLRNANFFRLADRRERDQDYDPAGHDRLVDTLIDIFSPAYFERMQGSGIDSELPVFIFGLPRSGTTLTEQVLAGHSEIYGAGELELAIAALDSTQFVTNQFTAAVEPVGRFDRQNAERMARTYLDRLTALNDRALRLVDKMPDNYLCLGLLATLFPRAKLIHCRRDLRDTALSCWMTDFRQIRWANHEQHLSARIRAYQRLMEHWRRVLPVPMLEVDYEGTVEDLEGTARRLVDWCGLSWEPACLAFHERRQPVRTASAAQVRQPIYRHAVGRWKHYETLLAPLFALLPSVHTSVARVADAG